MNTVRASAARVLISIKRARHRTKGATEAKSAWRWTITLMGRHFMQIRQSRFALNASIAEWNYPAWKASRRRFPWLDFLGSARQLEPRVRDDNKPRPMLRIYDALSDAETVRGMAAVILRRHRPDPPACII